MEAPPAPPVVNDLFEARPAPPATLPIHAPRGEPTPSPVFDTYWRFAVLRQDLFFAKIRHPNRPPWTDDAILRKHKFTNAYRASDRVSQYLIRKVIYADDKDLQTPQEVFFRTLLFKLFNKIETWQLLERSFGAVRWADYRFELYDRVLNSAIQSGERIYSAAYIMPSGRSAFGYERKHSNHLQLLERMMGDRLPERLQQSQPSLGDLYQTILGYPGIGPFLAYQYAIDLNYGPLIDASENDFVMPGPGALDGIAKCFLDLGGLSPAETIRWVCERQEQNFERLGLAFKDLWGRPLTLIDCQNLFCEVDKYARVKHPDVVGLSGRSRIKQLYRPVPEPIVYWYPPKWGINERIANDPRYEGHAASIRR